MGGYSPPWGGPSPLIIVLLITGHGKHLSSRAGPKASATVAAEAYEVVKDEG
jgi:hypothetical protein